MTLRNPILLFITITLAVAIALTLPVRVCEANEQDAVTSDNSAKNVRDRSNETLTPMDQGNSKRDLRITAAIRKKVLADSSLSTDAHNAKIITRGSVVTLRGPVATADERVKLQEAASTVRGVKRVDNRLEVNAN